MAGTHIYTSNAWGWVASECLRHLTNALVIADYGNRNYEKEFDREFAVGETITVKYPDEGNTREDLTFVPQNVDRRATNIVVDQIVGSDVTWDSLEKALQMERSEREISQQIIKPRMDKVAQRIDSKFAQFAFDHTYQIAGVLGTTPSALSTYNRARTLMQEQAVWNEGSRKAMLVTPAMMEGVASLPATQALFVQKDAADKAFKEGYFGRYGGFDWFESMSLVRQTAGTWAGTVETSSASQSGSSLALTCTTGDTFKKGDKFSLENVNFVNPMTKQVTRAATFTLTQTVTGASSAATIYFEPAIVGPGSPYQNVDALPGNGADLTLWPGTSSPNAKTGPCGLAITEEAFALVGVPLPMPTRGFETIATKRDPQTGLAVHIIAWMNPETRAFNTRIDTLFGFGVLRGAGSVAIASAA